MTRPLVKSGLPGPGQDLFPEQARELGRRMGLYPDEVIRLLYTPTESAGATRAAWTPQPAVDGRVDPMSGADAGMRGAAVDESSTHIVTFRNGQELSLKDRVRAKGQDWIINAIRERTDELVVRAEIKQVV